MADGAAPVNGGAAEVGGRRTAQGPDGAGDFISVAPRGSRWKRKLDWAFTATGSPANLAAPYSRGTYEVRYITGSDSKILEAVPITVE